MPFFRRLSAKYVRNMSLNYKISYMCKDISGCFFFFFPGFLWNLNYTICPVLLPVISGLFSFLPLTERAQCDLGRNHINNISSLSTLLILYVAGRGDGPTLASTGWSHNHCWQSHFLSLCNGLMNLLGFRLL